MFDDQNQMRGGMQDMTPSSAPGTPPSSTGGFMPPSQQPASPPMTYSSQATIHTMPDKFISGSGVRIARSGGSRGGRRMGIIIAVVALVLGGITAGAYFYLQSPNNIFTGTKPPVANQNQQQPPDQNVVPNTNVTPTNTTVTSDPQALERDAQRVADITVIAKALDAYYKRFGSYPTFLSVIPTDILAQIPVDPSSKSTYTYTTRDDRQTYTIIVDIEQQASFNDKIVDKGQWEFYPENFNQTANTNNQNTNQTVPTTTPPALGNLDADGDGLTSLEEAVFKTAPDSQDTDSDGFKDNIEIANFYSPIETGNIRLDQSGLVKQYTSPDTSLTFYYPSAWLAKVQPTDFLELLITAETGEDFSIKVSENPEKKTSWEWYTTQVNADYNQQHINLVQIAGHEAVRTLDGLQVYLAVDTKVYTIIYNLNTNATINYPNVFNLLLARLTVR